MTVINVISNCTMKPSSRILVIGRKKPSFLSRCHHSLTMSTSISNPVLNLDLKTKHNPSRTLKPGRIMNGFQRVLGLPSWSFGHSRTSITFRATKTKESFSCIGGVSFKAREFSDSVKTTRVNGERVYVKGVKPLRIDKDDNNKGERDEEESRFEGGDEKDLKKGDEEETEVEKEAWKLLQKALVTYCDTPVGTVAANDDSDKDSPLNYDQVFIRDFIPSALAFLLKGEKEIVKNFLLHTLQLQVIIIFRVFFGV